MKNLEDLNKCHPILNMQKNRKYNLPFFHEKSLKIAKKNKNRQKMVIFKKIS